MSDATTVTVRRPDGSTETLTYSAADFASPASGCDLVMKGGITSGVVYPLAVAELAKTYRFRGIGGTSVGAIAAAVTAAAEYARDRRGLEKLVQIPADLAGGLVEKFQPEPHLRPLFDMMLAGLKKPSGGMLATAGRVLWQAMRGYWAPSLVAMLAGLAVIFFGIPYAGWWAALLGIAVFKLLFIALVGWRIYVALTRELPAANFGLCSGKTVTPGGRKAFTDWLADLLDDIAARPATLADHPLTFADLEAGPNPVELRMMTSDLAMGRPYELPFRDRLHFFSKAEFDKLFPNRVVDYLVRTGGKLANENQNEAGDLYYLPAAKALPVVVAARMSLSFPGLIQAVPLYKRDFLLKTDADQARPIKCLFSDGGLTSNFPIHMFDRLWPNRPTFAINLDNFNPKADDETARVWMHVAPGAGQILPIAPVAGLGGFFWALFNTAKGWQDALQAVLPGYRERVIHIALKDDEGGLNLEMPQELIETLTGFGEEAGRHATAYFELGQHRWRRHLTAIARVEETLAKMFESHSPGAGPDNFAAFLANHDSSVPPYKLTQGQRAEFDLKTKELFDLAQEWEARMKLSKLEEIPHPESIMRITSQP